MHLVNDLNRRQEEIIAEFEGLSDWEARYEKVIALGKTLPEMDSTHKVEKNKVKGCQSQVWLHAQLDSEGRVLYTADSDAMIVKGLVSLLLRVYSEATPQQVLETEPEFIEKLGFSQNLSPSRTNGLFSMIKQIKLYATAFHFMQMKDLPNQ